MKYWLFNRDPYNGFWNNPHITGITIPCISKQAGFFPLLKCIICIIPWWIEREYPNTQITHTIHVWYIYLHVVDYFVVNVGKYTIHGWYGLSLIQNYLSPFKKHIILTLPSPLLWRDSQLLRLLSSVPLPCGKQAMFFVHPPRGLLTKIYISIQLVVEPTPTETYESKMGIRQLNSGETSNKIYVKPAPHQPYHITNH